MQQIFFKGPNAGHVAEQLFRALNVRPAGFTVLPFCVEGRDAGMLIHLLTAPPAGWSNDVPFRVWLRSGEVSSVVSEALNRNAASALRQVIGIGAPILLGSLYADMLACTEFQSAVKAALHGGALCVAVAEDAEAEQLLRRALPEADQLWLDTHDAGEALSRAVEEAMPRLIFHAR